MGKRACQQPSQQKRVKCAPTYSLIARQPNLAFLGAENRLFNPRGMDVYCCMGLISGLCSLSSRFGGDAWWQRILPTTLAGPLTGRRRSHESRDLTKAFLIFLW
jgi:hypothetical protein